MPKAIWTILGCIPNNELFKFVEQNGGVLKPTTSTQLKLEISHAVLHNML